MEEIMIQGQKCESHTEFKDLVGLMVSARVVKISSWGEIKLLCCSLECYTIIIHKIVDHSN